MSLPVCYFGKKFSNTHSSLLDPSKTLNAKRRLARL